MRRARKLPIFLMLVLLLPAAANADKFANQFTEFELPPQWKCNLESAEWVCQSENASKKTDAIIVLAAKLKGEQDSLDQYLAYLKNAKVWNSVQGKQLTSQPKYAKTVDVNGHPWVDSLHLESELPGFYTRYLATVKNDIGVLVTFSVNKAKYQDYLQDVENMVKTLRVFRKPGGINTGNNNLFQNVTMPQTLSEGTVFPVNPPQGGSDAAPKKKKAEEEEDLPLMPILAIGGIIAYIVWRRRRG
jgi:hypothetical protein